MSPEQLVEEMAEASLYQPEFIHEVKPYLEQIRKQRISAKYMLLVVLSHIEEIATVVDIRFPDGEFDNYRKVVLKEPYRKMLEEKNEKG